MNHKIIKKDFLKKKKSLKQLFIRKCHVAKINIFLWSYMDIYGDIFIDVYTYIMHI